jgi:hypothetical protein
VIVSVFVRRLKEGHIFKEFVEEWEADEGFGVPTRVFNGPSLDDPRMVVSIGFDAVTPDEVRDWLAAGSGAERARHARSTPSWSPPKYAQCSRCGPSTISPVRQTRSHSGPVLVYLAALAYR